MSENKKKKNAKSDDSKFAVLAVQFLIENSVRGPIALGASIAELLKENAKMAEELSYYKHKSDSKANNNNKSILSSQYSKLVETDSLLQHSQHSNHLEAASTTFDSEKQTSRKLIEKSVTPIDGCLCQHCLTTAETTKFVKPPLEIGDEIVTHDYLTAIVKYIGHVDFKSSNDVYVGIEFPFTIGTCDGTVDHKEYFSCSKECGHFILLYDEMLHEEIIRHRRITKPCVLLGMHGMGLCSVLNKALFHAFLVVGEIIGK